MNEAKSYTVKILNEQYSIQTDESAHHVTCVTTLVNKLMHEIMVANISIEPKKVAVLTSLRLADKLVHLESQLDGFVQKEQELITIIEGGLQ